MGAMGMSPEMKEAEEEPRRTARQLLRAMTTAALGTLAEDGGPYVALATPAADVDGAPLLFLSRLARHTRHLLRDPRAALLVDATRGLATPLAGTRMSLVGRMRPRDEPRALARYLRLRPDAERYRQFADFGLWRFEIEGAHLVLGFGRVVDLPAEALVDTGPEVAALAAAEPALVAEIDRDHNDLVQLLAERLLGERGGGWRLVALDADGFTLARRQRLRRLELTRPAPTPEAIRSAFLALVHKARRRPAEP